MRLNYLYFKITSKINTTTVLKRNIWRIEFVQCNLWGYVLCFNRNKKVQRMPLTDANGWKTKIHNKGQIKTKSFYNILQYLTNTIWSLYWQKYKYTRRRAINYTSEEYSRQFQCTYEFVYKEISHRNSEPCSFTLSLSLWQTSH